MEVVFSIPYPHLWPLPPRFPKTLNYSQNFGNSCIVPATDCYMILITFEALPHYLDLNLITSQLLWQDRRVEMAVLATKSSRRRFSGTYAARR